MRIKNWLEKLFKESKFQINNFSYLFFNRLKKEEKILVDCPKPLTTYHFIVASTRFLVNLEPIEEIFRERIQHYRRENKPKDFWFLVAPTFLNSNKLVEIKTKLSEANLSIDECSTVVSPDDSFIIWLKLRMNYVLVGSFVAPTEDIPSPLESNCIMLDLLNKKTSNSL